MIEEHHSQLFTVREAAEYLNFSRASMYRKITQQNLPTVQLLKRKQYILKETLDDLIANPTKVFVNGENNVNW
jgi:excisionase family DNA binding protein